MGPTILSQVSWTVGCGADPKIPPDRRPEIGCNYARLRPGRLGFGPDQHQQREMAHDESLMDSRGGGTVVCGMDFMSISTFVEATPLALSFTPVKLAPWYVPRAYEGSVVDGSYTTIKPRDPFPVHLGMGRRHRLPDSCDRS